MATRNVTFPWPIGLVVAAHVFVWDFAALANLQTSQPVNFSGVFRGCYFAQLGLVSLWVALGAGHWKTRWVIGLIALIHIWGAACSANDWWRPPSSGQYGACIAVVFFCLVVAAGKFLRHSGQRLLLRRATPHSLPVRSYQISMRVLLFAPAAVAVYLGVILKIRKQMWSLQEFKPLPHNVLLATAFTATYGVWFLLVSVILLRAQRCWMAVPFILAASPLVGAAVGYLLHTTESFWFWAAGSETAVVVASITVIRAAGYRLVSKAEAVAEIEANRRFDADLEVAAVAD